jgi:plastocyanin
MKIHGLYAMRCAMLALPLVLLVHNQNAHAQKKNPYVCKEPDPTALCTAATTCGSTSEPCSVDVKRTSNAASATPSIPGAKGNATFCVKAGTSVTWKSDTKHQGFVVDMGPTSPFDPPDDIVGGSAKSVTVTAKTPGCYRFSAGACLSGAIYGMCGNGTAELVILK